MEKKIDKRFYQLSALNLITCFYLGNGDVLNTLVFIGFLGVLIFNHTALTNMVTSLTSGVASSDEIDSKRSLKRVLFFFFAKLMVLALAMGLIYFYKKDLIVKLMILMIFQLIIQVLSIKNRYQIS